MSDRIEYVSNYHDLSNDKGFQFEFVCNHCGSGYRTRFKPSVTGNIAGALDTASSLFGGILGSAANLSSRVHNAAWQKAHDSALEEAIQEFRPEFMQCPRCQSWVCAKKCWNTRKGLCKTCAPDVGVEMAAAQASRTTEEIWAHAAMAEEDKHLTTEDWREGIRATCPECNQPLDSNAKFCPSCGAKVKREKHCTECGAKMQPEAKFCGECGHKAE